MKQHISPRTPRHQRRIGGRSQDDHVEDTYKASRKLAEPTVCAVCGAVFHEGRWQWRRRPAKAEETTCQACHRIKDKYPAGILTLKGAFPKRHRDEILGLARHNEELEKKDHPLNRIMDVAEKGDEIVITTTDIHLPRRIGDALRHAYHGELDFHYDKGHYFIRVNWLREE